VMTSSGALQAPNALLAKDTILSGPAAGMVGAIAAARAAGFERVPVLGFDMGGTSTDVFCVASADDQTLRLVQEQTEIAGLQLLAPRLPIETVAAGGGSVLERDGDRLRVGPRSAGASPGPACYGAGGPLTVTDANMLLGRLQCQHFPAVFGPDHDQPPDLAVVQQRFAQLAEGLQRSPEQLAEGALQLAIERMANAIRRVSLHRGQDIRDGLLVSYGGAGGQHACRLADELGLASVLLHPMAGVLSAYGMGQARQRRRLQQHLGAPLTPTLLRQLPDRVQLLYRLAYQHLREQGDIVEGAADDLDPWISLELRSGGAEQTVVLTWTPELSLDGLVDAFHDSHQHRFGYRCEADQCLVVEMLSLELAAPQQHNTSRGCLAPLPTAPERTAGGLAQQVRLHLPGRGWCAAPLFQRNHLALGEGIRGPALIVETTGCTVLEPGWSARVAAAGELLLEREQRVSPLVSTASCTDQQDPVQAELFRHRFMAIAEQMGEQLRQSSRSVNIRERLDFSCALFDGAGTLVANAPHIPVHLGSMGDSVRDLVGQVDLGAVPSLQPGDTLLSNDPFHGGTHLPDITAITPVFCGGSIDRKSVV